MTGSESLPYFTIEKPCPRCSELLHWSDVNPPQVGYNTRTGRVWQVILTRFCINCGYEEEDFVIVDQDPHWKPKKAEGKQFNSFAIMTTITNSLMQPIHNRMPVILKKEYEELYGLCRKKETLISCSTSCNHTRLKQWKRTECHQ
jgi:SOS response associated peptidase (SRAP)